MSEVPLMDSVTGSEIEYYAKKTSKYTGTKMSDIIEACLESGYSRYPVFEEDSSIHITGFCLYPFHLLFRRNHS